MFQRAFEHISEAQVSSLSFSDTTQFVDYFPSVNLVISQALSFYLDVIPPGARAELHAALRRLFGRTFWSAEHVFDRLKTFSDLYKKGGPLLTPNWHYFVDLSRVYGYYRGAIPHSLLEEATSWVGSEKAYHPFFVTNPATRHSFLSEHISISHVDVYPVSSFMGDFPSRS